MPRMYLDPCPEFAKAVARAAFPDYTGRRYALETHAATVNVVSYWDGGSRDYFAFVRLADLAVLPVPQNGTPFDGGPLAPVAIPDGAVCVEHSIFCGKDHGITFHVPDSAVRFLPAAPSAHRTWAEYVVLCAVGSLKNTYGGQTNIRETEAIRETGITSEEYRAAFATLTRDGLLNRAGAITPNGRNALSMGPHGSYVNLRTLRDKRPNA